MKNGYVLDLLGKRRKSLIQPGWPKRPTLEIQCEQNVEKKGSQTEIRDETFQAQGLAAAETLK